MTSMDFIQESGVKIPNAVIVSGITQEAEQDEQVMDFLKQYGKIDRVLLVDDSQSEFFQNLIVEYSSGSAIESLEPHLPYTCTTQGSSPVLYEVKTLSSTYATKVGSNATKTYLAELKRLAKMSGKDYSEVLKEMMSQIGEDVEALQHMAEGSSPTRVETTVLSPPAQEEPQLHTSFSDDTPSNNVATDHVTLTNAKRAPSFSLSDVNPPDVQKVVVEHIVRRQDSAHHMQTQVRLRTFSGKTPTPNHETDYDTWRTHIELLQNDLSMSPLQISRKILENLLPPAADVVKGLRPESPPAAYLQLLDSAFGTVEDGEELFAQFLNTLQDSGEKPSTYLHRLQLVLNRATKRGGVAHGEVDKHLLKQFCRGCWDNTLLSTLQLEQKKSSPPKFSDLLVMIRSEEDRQQAKSSRMKKHIGITKQKAQVQFHGAYVGEPEEKSVSSISAIEDLRRQVASLQSQLTTFMSQKKTKGANSKGSARKHQSQMSNPDDTDTGMQRHAKKKQTYKPKPWYCFNCGEDGHIAPSCNDPANPRLVAEKKRQLEKKQHQWETQNGSNTSLND
ncbi:zinc finger CCHC domain-containing protein 18-like [Puntigrus tetrazona]|uniref:zinc finger CCHC domain-containing protein 18-like n=1 Tax=Puntigrus tetrazona TaxID=1606681 RepID=UPI001C89E92F|nr:zinc finger CCHC domain-containing protein 18-like [Puntigrus tetrazona]